MSHSSDTNEREPSRWQRQVDSIIETQINRYPYLVQGRAVLRQLRHERESWPLLIPLLLFVFFVVYRRERRKLLIVQQDVED
jgi:hypothetical protein